MIVSNPIRNSQEHPQPLNYSSPSIQGNILTADRHMQELLQLSETVAKSKAAVLIQGEAGSGKRTLAQFIHQKSQRVHKPLEWLNTSAISRGLLETEFYQHLEKAHGGTLLILEVGKLTSALQMKLFQVLQEGTYVRPGQLQAQPIDVRLITTSTYSLSQLVKSGEFREDLFYKLNVVNIKIPSLHDRLGDIEVLAQAFVKKWSGVHGRGVISLSAEAIQYLNGHRWPGNVRELESTLERAVLFNTSGEIKAKDVQIQNPSDASTVLGKGQPGVAWRPGRTLDEIERNVIIDALKYHSGNRTHTAKALGISIRTLRNKLAEYRVLGIHL